MQKYLVKAHQEGDNQLFDHIFDCTVTLEKCWELMNDSFGNYLVQKICEICRDEQLTRVIESMGFDPLQLCKNSHGTRSVQKLIETARLPEHFSMIQLYLKKLLRDMSEDINGNHVIQKILQCWDSKQNQFIYDEMCVKNV